MWRYHLGKDTTPISAAAHFFTTKLPTGTYEVTMSGILTSTVSTDSYICAAGDKQRILANDIGGLFTYAVNPYTSPIFSDTYTTKITKNRPVLFGCNLSGTGTVTAAKSVQFTFRAISLKDKKGTPFTIPGPRNAHSGTTSSRTEPHAHPALSAPRTRGPGRAPAVWRSYGVAAARSDAVTADCCPEQPGLSRRPAAGHPASKEPVSMFRPSLRSSVTTLAAAVVLVGGASLASYATTNHGHGAGAADCAPRRRSSSTSGRRGRPTTPPTRCTCSPRRCPRGPTRSV